MFGNQDTSVPVTANNVIVSNTITASKIAGVSSSEITELFVGEIRPTSGTVQLNIAPASDNGQEVDLLITPNASGWSSGQTASMIFGESGNYIKSTYNGPLEFGAANGFKIGANGSSGWRQLYAGSVSVPTSGSNDLQVTTTPPSVYTNPIILCCMDKGLDLSTSSEAYVAALDGYDDTSGTITFRVRRVDTNSGWSTSTLLIHFVIFGF